MALHDILVRVGADISGLTSGFKRATTTLTGFAGIAVYSMDRFVGSATGAAAAATSAAGIATAASAATVGALVAHAAQFENAFADVRKTVSASGDQFEQLSKSIRNMSTVMPETAEEIAGVAASAGQLGVEVDNIEAFTETMTMMGVATNMSATDAATALAQFMNIMGTEFTQVDRLGATVVDLGNNLATTEKSVVDLATRLAGAGAQVNMSEADVLSFAGSLSSLGLRTEMAGTAFSRVMLEMNTATMEGGESLETFAAVSGMTAEQFRSSFQEDASGAIVSFIGGLKDMSDSGQNTIGVLDELSLGEIRVRDTLLRASEGVDLVTDSLELGRNAWSENTALQEEYTEKSSTLIARLKILGNQFSYVARVVGVLLMDALGPVIGAVENFMGIILDWAKSLEDASETTKQWVGGLILAVPAGLGFITVVAGITAAVLGLYSGLTSLAVALDVSRIAALKLIGTVGGIIAVALAIAAAVVVVGVALVSWFTRSSDEAERLKGETESLEDSTESLSKSVQESASAYADQQKSMQENYDINSSMVDKLSELAAMEDKSLGDKRLMTGVIDDLNGSIAGLNLTYDEQTDSLNKSAEEIQARIDLMHEEEKGIAAQQRLAEIAQERIDTELELERVNALRNDWNEAMRDGEVASSEYYSEIKKLNELEEELVGTLEDLGLQHGLTAEQVEEASNKMTEIIQENNFDQIQSYEDLDDAQKEIFDNMIETYKELRDAAVNAFEQINTESEYSLAEMIENMEHNRKATEEWGENRAAIMEWASKEGHTGFMKWVEKLGIDHAGELGEMAKALDENSGTQIELLEELAQGYDDNSQAATDAFGANLDEGFEGALKMMIDFVSDSSSTMQSEMFDAGFDEIGATAPEEMAKGVEGKSDEVTDEMDAILDASQKAFNLVPGIFSTIGNNTMEGFRLGVASKEDSIMSTASGIANRVTDTFKRVLSIHSPSRVLRKEVGQMLGAGLWLGMEDEISNISKMAERLTEAATPETPILAGIDNEDFRGHAASIISRLTADVSGFNIDREDESDILGEVRDELRFQSAELRKQKQTIIEMDKRIVGEIVEPEVSEIQERNRDIESAFA